MRIGADDSSDSGFVLEQMHPAAPRFLAGADVAPAISGVIGKVALTAAFAWAWAASRGIPGQGFVTENVRLELFVAAVFTLACCVLPTKPVSPPGTLAPLIPLIPSMAADGVHPLHLALLTGLLGLLMTRLSLFDRIAGKGGISVRAGMLLLLGMLGMRDVLGTLWRWSHASLASPNVPFHASGLEIWLLFIGTGLAVTGLLRWNRRENGVIPCLGVMALLISYLIGRGPVISATPGWPVIDPLGWWQFRWGDGMPAGWRPLLSALPYSMLILVLWPMDAMAIRSLQTQGDAQQGTRTAIDLRASFTVISLRNLIGALLGGAQTAAVWRSFLIPLARSGRPVRGAALLLAIGAMGVALLGFPIDLAVHPPLVGLVLLFGVFVPLVEAGVRTLRQSFAGWRLLPVGMMLVIGLTVGPIWGWGGGLLAEWLWLRHSAGRRTEG